MTIHAQKTKHKWNSGAQKNHLVTFELSQCVEDIWKEIDVTQDQASSAAVEGQVKHRWDM